MTTTGMNHFTVLTDDVAATVDFYRDLIGLAGQPQEHVLKGRPGAGDRHDGQIPGADDLEQLPRGRGRVLLGGERRHERAGREGGAEREGSG